MYNKDTSEKYFSYTNVGPFKIKISETSEILGVFNYFIIISFKPSFKLTKCQLKIYINLNQPF